MQLYLNHPKEQNAKEACKILDAELRGTFNRSFYKLLKMRFQIYL